MPEIQGGIDYEVLREELKSHALQVFDAKVDSDWIYYVSSGSAWAVRDLTVDGTLRNDGELLVRNLYNNGKVINNGVIEGGA